MAPKPKITKERGIFRNTPENSSACILHHILIAWL